MKYNLNESLILKLAASEDVFSRGKKYFEDEKIISMWNETAPNKEVVNALVDGSYKKFNPSITFSSDGDIQRFSCDCDAMAIWKGSCKHVIAVLIAILENSKKTALKDYNSMIANKILENFENSFLVMSQNEDVNYFEFDSYLQLKPFLILEKESFSAYFKIGYDNLFVVKNIDNLIDLINDKKSLTYGKKTKINHDINGFDDSSKQLIELISSNIRTYKDSVMAVDKGFSSLCFSRDSMVLTPRFFDIFFDIYLNQIISLNNENVLFCNENLPIKLLVDVCELEIKITWNKTKFEQFEGFNYHYFLFDYKFYRVDKETGSSLSSLLKGFFMAESDHIVFSKEHYKTCLSFVVPFLAKNDFIDKDSEIFENFSLNKLTPHFYLDSLNKKIELKLVFDYENVSFNPLVGAKDNIVRDVREEAKILLRLKSYGFVKNLKTKAFYIKDEEQIFNFYKYSINKLFELGEVFLSEAFKEQSLKPFTSKKINVRLKGDLLNLSIEENKYMLSDFSNILNAFQNKKRYFRLKNNAFIDFSDDEFKNFAEVLSSLNLSKKDFEKLNSGEIDLPKFKYFHLKELENEDVISYDENINLLLEDIKNYEQNEEKCPEKLENILRYYQIVGYKWMKMLLKHGLSGILADDMGLGKTLQIITLLLSEKGSTEKPSIVVAPASLIYNWAHEIEKFADELSYAIIIGNPQKRASLLSEKHDVFITTYDTLKRDIKNFENYEFRFIIADEAQYIKNPSTQNAKALKSLQAEGRFALTGTPIENSLMELWSIFDFVMPGYLLSSENFTNKFEINIIKENDTNSLNLLKKLVSPFILRRLKKDVLKELPEKLETNIYAEMEPEQKKIYGAYLLSAKGELEECLLNNFSNNKIKILSLITRLRQICNHPAIFLDNYEGSSGKLNVVLETILSAKSSSHRILLFSQFTQMLKILMKTLDDNQISYYYLDGSTNLKLRQNMVDKFNSGYKDVFLISLKAGGTGLNLTGADVVIHYDEWWNPAVMNQATDRAYRIGQEKAVQVIHVVTKDSIEERILSLQDKKKNLVDSVLNSDASFLNALSIDEIRELFAHNPQQKEI